MAENSNANVNNKAVRTVVFVAISIVASLCFAIFNFALFARLKTAWNLCISIYYLFVFAMKLAILFYEIKVRNGDATLAHAKRVRANLVYCALLFVVDVSLIAPVVLMSLGVREVNYTKITAIAFASYTVYKITASAANLKKAHTADNLSARTLRMLNFKDAILSIATLQYVLIATFGNSDELTLMCRVTNFILWAFIVYVSVWGLVYSVREKKKLQIAT